MARPGASRLFGLRKKKSKLVKPSPQVREPVVALSVPPADEIKTTTCYMCACRCGIRVFLKDGKIRYIEGNRDHPVNKGVLCGKGAAGIMQHYSPARLQAPLLRVGPRGSGDFREISWDEALGLAAQWLGDVRRTDPRKLAFFTGRDQSQSLTGWWAMMYGTPNFAAHGGFCSVNMAAAGMYTFGGSFWEFGDTDWDRTRYFLMFGVAEDHASNPIKIALGKLKKRGVKIVSVNPVRTGYSAIADEWIGIKPGTDGLFAGSLIHELLDTQQIDLDYLVRYTNSPWLVIRAPGAPDDGLFARDAAGAPLVHDKTSGKLASGLLGNLAPSLSGTFRLADGREAVPVFQLLAERFLADTYAPERTEKETGIAAATVRRIAAELAHAAFKEEITLDIPWTDWTGRRHDKMIGRPVGMHAMRGISAHANGFHTCRILHILQILLGSIDCPGGFRYKAPYPKLAPPFLKPRGKPGDVEPGKPLPGPQLGFPTGPDDLLVDAQGTPQRIDKAFSWDAPFAAHGMMHMVIANAARGDPYPIDVLFLYMANMGWNSAMDLPATLAHLTDKDADDRRVQDPSHHLLGRLLLRDGALCRSHPARHDLPRALGLHLAARPPDLRARRPRRRHPPAGGRARPRRAALPGGAARSRRAPEVARHGQGGRNAQVPRRLSRLHRQPRAAARHRPARRLPRQERRRFRPRRGQPAPARAVRRRRLLPCAPPARAHALLPPRQQGLHRVGARQGHAADDDAGDLPALQRADAEDAPGRPRTCHRHAARGASRAASRPISIRCRSGIRRSRTRRPDETEFPMHAITQRPMAMYHSWGSQNAWLRQIHGANRLYMNRARAHALGIADDDWVWITSRIGRVKAQVKLMEGVNADTVWTWNAIGKRSGHLGSRRRCPGSDARLPAQPPDRRAAARAARRLPLLQQRSRHRPGRLVRPQGAHQQGRRA